MSLYVATRKGLFTLEQEGSHWKISRVDFLGETVTMLLPDRRDGLLYAVLTLGHYGTKLRRTADGRQWQEVGVPVYPDGAEYPVRPESPEAEPKMQPASLKEIWALEAGGAEEPGVLWAGTIPGGLFRSNDRGDTWELIEALWNRTERMQWFGGGKDHPGIHSVCVDPRDSRMVRIGISCGGMWQTNDGGASWECRGQGLRAEYMPPELAYDPNIQDAHRLAQCAVEPDKLWIQHHNGIFRSVDGGASWQEIENVQPSGFGFAVVVDPAHGDTAWFVPGVKDETRVPPEGRFLVNRTRDGGVSFEALRNGLPQQHAYELVYRHALDIDSSGRRLAMGSTTGGLWVSEDAGDTWSLVSHTLPPIYCVRFG
mgnify:CR=1 FL=1